MEGINAAERHELTRATQDWVSIAHATSDTTWTAWAQPSPWTHSRPVGITQTGCDE